MIKHYLRDRVLVYDTREACMEQMVTAGAAPLCILGPDLWNASYNGILRMEMPGGAFLVGYADDITAIIEASDLERAQMKLNQVMRRVCGWLEDHDIDLAVHKTEILIMPTMRKDTVIPMQVGTETIETMRAVKHLGVKLDTKLTFWEQIKDASNKAATSTTALKRLMENVGGSKPGKRRLLMSVTQNILLYGAEIWKDALNQ